MGRNLVAQIANYLSSRKRRKLGYWLLCSLGAVVVFCTVYALVLPAITMPEEPVYEMEPPAHDEGSLPPVDLVPELEPEPELICGEWKDADVVFHTHTDLCYDSVGKLICPLEERVQHIHDENCYIEQETLICGKTAGEPEEPSDDTAAVSAPQPYIPAHTHTAACYRYERGKLICGLEEAESHQHDGTCYAEVSTGEVELICGLEESDMMGYDEAGNFHEQIHHHNESCYRAVTETVLVCGLEETEGHAHTDECYERKRVLICGKEETEGSGTPPEETQAEAPEEPAAVHIHTEECYEITRVLVCQEEEYQLHTHGPECYETSRVDDGMGGFETQETLICELPVVIEHQHTDACVAQGEGDG